MAHQAADGGWGGSVDVPGVAPMPDPETGEPRPPRGPVVDAGESRRQPWHSRKVPQPPAGEGRVLEWCYFGDARNRVGLFVSIAVLTVGFVIVHVLTVSPGPYGRWVWLTSWKFWVALVVVCLLYAWLGSRPKMSAGAAWLMFGKRFVRTYELTSVKVRKSDDWHEGLLVLEDAGGHELSAQLYKLRINHDLWDLVYNGIRTSVANGAFVNQTAMETIELRDVLLWRHEYGGRQ